MPPHAGKIESKKKKKKKENEEETETNCPTQNSKQFKNH